MFYDSELHLSLCALEVVASGIDDIIVQTLCAKKGVVLIVIIEIIEFDAIPIQKSSGLIGGD
jgi:hypothetical protein